MRIVRCGAAVLCAGASLLVGSPAYGGGGVSDEAGLAKDYAHIRTLRLADGPDEVHNRAIARLELRKYANATH